MALKPATPIDPYEDLLASGDPSGPPSGAPEDEDALISINYTSGTTGQPKGAVLTHEGVLVNVQNYLADWDLRRDDSTVVVNPIFHVVLYILTVPLLYKGGKVVLMEDFDAAEAVRLAERERITVWFAIPTAWQMILATNSTTLLPTVLEPVIMTPGDGARYHVPAALRALAVLEYLASAQEPRGASFLARRLGIPKSSCFSLLLTLEQAGYVRRNGRDEWSLTLRIYHIGMRAARNLDVLVLAQPILQELVDDLGLTAHLGVFERGRVVYALKVETPGMVRFETYPGKPATLHLTAVGRAVASILGKRELDGLLDGVDRLDGTLLQRCFVLDVVLRHVYSIPQLWDWPLNSQKISLPRPRSSPATSAIMKITKAITTKK